MKKTILALLSVTTAILMLAGCSNGASSSAPASTPAASPAVSSQSPADSTFSGPITVVSREDGSGTRGAFVELTGVEEKNEAGEKEDMTTESAVIMSSTSAAMTAVAGDEYAIGYISLGSLNDTVKALEVDGAPATVEAIKSGEYKVSRPFLLATKDDLSEVAQDFMDFILSAEGQAVVEENHYIAAVESAPAYAGSKPSGKVVVGGSSSVTPVMEKLAEAYKEANPNATVEVQMSDSSTGMTQAIDGVCDIGMASRELKDSEKEAGLTPTTIAIDGIAIIVNNANPTAGLTSAQIKAIFTGEVTNWSELAE